MPKIHKPGNPGRPIISGIGTLTENISGFVEKILKPLVHITPSFVLDTSDFLNKINDLVVVPQDAILATLDVSSLYSNIPNDDGLEACKYFLDKRNCQDPPTTDIIKLTEFILKHNYFNFENKLYLQVLGTAMGTRMAPQYANLFMAHFEENFFMTYPKKPLLYYRYIDDVFLIWEHGEDELVKFQDALNQHHPSIKFTMEFSNDIVNFLDTQVFLNDDKLTTSVYKKPTDSNSYLHFESFHPDRTKKSIVYSQSLRYNRICSSTIDRDRALANLRNDFVAKKYPEDLIDSQIDKAKATDRHLGRTRHHDNNSRVPLVVTYHPQLLRLSNIARRLHPMLTSDPDLAALFPYPPILAFKQPRNVGKSVINRKNITHDVQESGTFPCHQARCLTCQHIVSDTILKHPNGKTFTIRGHFTCKSSGIIYLIRCKLCPLSWYVGETSTPLHIRINGHRKSIKDNSPVPVAEHFNLAGHSLNDLTICVLKGNLHEIKNRKAKEVGMILFFDTQTTGLNIDIGLLSHYI